MKKLRIISLILVLTLALNVITFAEDKSEQEIATIMNQIGLLSGDGTGFNLSGNLTRAEAATFVVKLIGKEKTVLASPSFYGMTPFSDVKGDEWFAPFVGYCSMNGIISGYPDNTFRADDQLTEKAFLTMMLKALSYDESDFSWDNVFLKAYEKGIVDNPYYAFKTEDNSITRGRVLALEYNALKLKYKNSTKTMIDNLISNNIVSQSKAKSLDLVQVDSNETEITQVEAVSENTIHVTLNETIESLSMDQVKVDIDSTEQTVSSVVTTNNTVKITLSASSAEKDMTVTLLNVEDSANNIVSQVSSQVTGYVIPEVESDYFKVKSAEGQSQSIVNVYFTQPVDINASLVVHYEILQNGIVIADSNYNDLEVAVLGEVDNGVSLYMKNESFLDNVVYTVKVKGSLTSAYNVNLNEGKEMTVDFTGDDSSNKSLKVTDVEAISSDTIRVTFNQDIDKNLAVNISNYTLRNESNNSNSAVLSASMNETGPEKNRILDLRVLDMTKNKNYELTILNARNTFKSSTIANKSYDFTSGSYGTANIDLEYVQVVSNTKLHLYFDKAIHQASIAASISGVSDVLSTYTKEYNNRLIVYLDKDEALIEDKNYSVQVISGLIDASGKTQPFPLSYSIKGVDKEESDITVEDARFVSDNKVKVTFNSEISLANQASQYKLQYKNDAGHDVSITADSVNYVDSKTVVASFSNLPSETYQIYLDDIVDPSNQFTTQEITIEVTKE